MKRVVLEALLLALVGAGFGLLANALSPRGLHLARNYDNRKALSATPAPVAPGATNAPDPALALAGELKAQGLQLARSNLVLKLFHDPGYQQGQVVFVDARHPEDYEQGHIPGAYLFDYAHPEEYLNTVFPACQAALHVVVYCNGGHCDDSERAAIFLRDLGIPKDRLCVYGGGISEWRQYWPVETGEQNSGKLLKPKP